MKKYLYILLFLISSTSIAATKQIELDGIKLGTRVDSLGIKLDNDISVYTYKTQYYLWGSFGEKGHPIFAIEKLCKESGYSASLDGIGCNHSYQELKAVLGSKILPICDDERYDDTQTPYAFFDKSTNHFWMVQEKQKISAVGIASGVGSIPGAEGGSQVCLTKEELGKKQQAQKDEERSKERARQIAKEKAQQEFVATLLNRRKTPWISWPHYGFTSTNGYYSGYVRTDYYYDPKSISRTRDGQLILIRKDTKDYDSVVVSLIEMNCKKETYREFQEFTFDTPIQAVKLKKIGTYDGIWNYIDPDLIHAELYKKVCD